MVIYITIPFQDIDILLWYGYLNNHNGTQHSTSGNGMVI